MSLEATYIVLDNSEYMRNGDFVPSRMEAVTETVNLLSNAKTSQNPENTVGLITCAGRRVEVLQTLSQDPTTILSAMHNIEIGGEADLLSALQVAQLALKHRSNKNGGQRIIAFVGSPVNAESKALVRVGKKLKKNNISLDVISLGEEGDNATLLKDLMEAVNNKDDTSHLVEVPSTDQILADILISTAIFFSGAGDAGDAGAGGAAAAGGFPGGVDPNMDPELYQAIQMSLQEAAEREEKAAAAGGEANSNDNAAAAAGDPTTPVTGNAGAAVGGTIPMELGDDMDEDMKAAIAMSLQMDQGDDDLYGGDGGGGEGDGDEDEALKLSLQLAEQAQKEEELKNSLQNEEYVKNLFGDLDVDMEDAKIQEALKALQGGASGEGEKKEEKKDDEEKKDGSGDKMDTSN